ncbi:MAG: hypothetical protein KDK99_06250 [Verrucomicrobiales bacterium]|nr:hypothetical protein [Verrucomicrobiales bacterium]
MKDGYEATRIAIEKLRELQVPHMVVGGLSSNAYGIPRSTKDADIVLAIDAKGLFAAARELAPDFVLDDQGTFEMVTGTMRFHLRVPQLPFEIELFLLSSDPHDQARFERRRPVISRQIGTEIVVPSAEDVIIMKLRWAKIAKRTKDIDDVRDVIAVQGDDVLDWDYIHLWTAEHGTRKLLDEIRASIPPID